jgi:hypothetical protein
MVSIVKKVFNGNRCKMIYSFLRSLYDICLKNIMSYYQPVELKIVFNNKKNKFKKFNRFVKYDDKIYDFFYKINKLERNNDTLYNYGYFYHTDTINLRPIKQLCQAYPPDDIFSIRVKFTNNESIIIPSNILFNATEDTKILILIYYYLQYNEYINNIIRTIEFDIYGKYYLIDHTKTLRYIYDKLINDN